MTQKLKPLALGLAGGIFWGISLFAWTLISLKTGYSREVLELIAKIYPHYSISLTGSLLGLLYGLADGFICCFILAWLYNRFAR